MGMPGREFTAGNEYRYGFNGQLRDKDVRKDHHTALFWEYDPRIGRRWNVDPKPNPSISVYNAFAGNPILITDPLGDTTYLYSKRGVYKGVLLDKKKTNEVVVLDNARLNGILKGQQKGSLTDDEYADIARDPKIAIARITPNTVNEINKMWKRDGENTGLLYVDENTKEVHASFSKRAGSKSGDEAGIEGLGIDYGEVSKKGNVIGIWHSHPVRNSISGTNPSKDDQVNPTYIKQFKRLVQIGVITQKEVITIFPIGRPVVPYTENKSDFVTTPIYTPLYNGFKSTFQYGTFNRKLTPKTQWDQ